MKPYPRKESGFVLITSVMILMALLLVGSYLISSSGAENKISLAQTVATRDYYLAETAINEMIWKIQNNTTTKLRFLLGTLTPEDSISRNNVFGDQNASYQVAAINTTSSEAWVIATATYSFSGHASRRVVKSYVNKAINTTTPWQYSTFSGGRGNQQNGNLVFTGSGVIMICNGGRLHANQVFKVQKGELIVNNGGISSSNVIEDVSGGVITLNNSFQSVPTTTINMLQIDFDSTDPKSWKNRATNTYSAQQFNSLPGNTVLTGITYVEGDAVVKNKNFTINGILVVNGSFELDNSGKNFTINYDISYGSGLLAKGNLSLKTAAGTVEIDGLIYSGNVLDLNSADTDFTVNGALAGFDSLITASGQPVILNYNADYISQATDPEFNPKAPLIVITHWEEEY